MKSNSIKYFLSGIFFLTSFCTKVYTQMPPHPSLLEKIISGEPTQFTIGDFKLMKSKGVDEPWSDPALKLQKRTVGLSRDFGPKMVPSGNYKALAILVKFTDKPSQVNASYFDNLLFGQGAGTLRDYYKKVSYGILDIVTIDLPGTIGWVTAPQPYSYYMTGHYGYGNYPNNVQKLAEDVVNAADALIDFSKYDNDGDGYVDDLFIIHAGSGAEYSGSYNDIWSHSSMITSPIYDGVRIHRYSFEPEYWAYPGDMTCGVYAHEMGHTAFGLPDLYDTDYSSYGLGKWSLMSYGSWNGSLGNTPALPDAWSHFQMGYLIPKQISSDLLGQTINNVENTPEAYALWNDLCGTELFLVENRQKLGYDLYLPGSGLCIYHIDVNEGSNQNEWYPGSTSTEHYGVALEQADGLWSMEHKKNQGNSGDPYPGSTNNTNFSNLTIPDSKRYNTSITDVAVSNISSSSLTMTADFKVNSNAPLPQFSEQFLVSLVGISCYSIAWGDYDNDGYLDLLVTGERTGVSENNTISEIFHNNGDGTFSKQSSISLTGVIFSSVDWGDYDNDGYLDIIITGSNASYNEKNPIAKVYHNNRNNTFSEQTSISLPGVYEGTLAWGDYDNDGDLDLIIAGANKISSIAKIFRNDGNNIFTEQTSISLKAFSNGTVAWGDYDNDGDLDILLTGCFTSNNFFSTIYRNNGDNTFTEQTSISLTDVYFSSAAWGDYDCDGDLDIILTGYYYYWSDGQNGTIAKIYRNNGNNSFTEQTSITLTGVYYGSIAWGDYDNDGDLDLFLSGREESTAGISKIYRNNGDNSFTEQPSISLPGLVLAKWGDYDNDNDLDLFLTSLNKIYCNNNVIKNTQPNAPSNLKTVVNGNDVTFSWDKSTDKETPQNGLSYNLVIGTSPGACNILSPMSDRNTGKRRIVALGNANMCTSKTIRGLADGQYYWSVQAIDNNFAGSLFATEQSFNTGQPLNQCPPSMISYWKLNETSGSQYIDDVGSNTAKALSAIPIPCAGRVNGAQQFNGTTSKIDVPANPSFDFLKTSSFSVEFWYKGSTIPTTVKSAIGRYIVSSGARWWAGLNAGDGKARFYMSAGGRSTAVNGTVITDGSWHHVAATRNGRTGSLKLYVDGVLRSSTSQIFTIDFTSPKANLNIGWFSFQDAYTLTGSLDEVAIYNTELLASDIQQHYNKGLSGIVYCGPQQIAPVITSTPITTGLAGQLYSYDVEADGVPSPVFSLITYPSGMTINSSTGLIQWTPASAGKYNVTVQASNGVNPPAQQSFVIAVNTLCPSSMISYWKLNEASGTQYPDDVGPNIAYAVSTVPIPCAGRVNGAQQFNGTSAKIEVPANPSFDFLKTSSFSVEFWYKGSTVPATVKSAVGRYIVGSGARWWAGLNASDGKARFYMSAGGRSAAVNGTVITDGNWHHIAAARNGKTGSLKLYVDGVLNSSTNQIFTTDFTSPTAKLNIGWFSFQDAYTLTGCLDEVAIYNSELQLSDIQQHYNNGLSGLGYCSGPAGLAKDGEDINTDDASVSMLPKEYQLFQNYPNPFNPTTRIRFSVPEERIVKIAVYNQLGEQLRELVNRPYGAGTYDVEFNTSGTNMSSGIYFYKMEAGEFISVKKLLLLK